LVSVLLLPARVSAQRLLGLDVSAWQGNISQTTWNNIHNVENRQFVFIRASRGGTTGYYHPGGGYPSNNDTAVNLSQRYDDPYYIQNINRATTAGMFAGSYHFSRPDIIASTPNSGGIPNNGTDEANHFIQMAGAFMRPGYLMPIHDFEAGQSQRTANELAQFCLDFSNRIYEVMGIRPGIYINGSYTSTLNSASASLRNQLAQPPANLPSVVSPAYSTLWDARWPNQTNPDSIDVQKRLPGAGCVVDR
jgi:GH25 family lysozyme M1 (1,4-beta-N-acetylmuramidase)